MRRGRIARKNACNEKPNRLSRSRNDFFPLKASSSLCKVEAPSGRTYQAGVYEALAESSIHPDWNAGISIGAINAAIIVGNPPNLRVERLREF